MGWLAQWCGWEAMECYLRLWGKQEKCEGRKWLEVRVERDKCSEIQGEEAKETLR